MKKNSISTAVLASLAGIAGIANISSAVNINPDGTGQVLIYPYYTANAGNQTLLSVVNTTSQGKAVKVRILEGRNSFEVLDFNLFLSREDVWTAAILNLGVGAAATAATTPASIATFDTSCTSPLFSSAGTVTASGLVYVDFRNFLYLNDTVGGIDLNRTREGHIEIIEMATLTGALNTAITHVNDVPRNCGLAQGFIVNNPALGDPANIAAPSGGLFGGGAVINIANGTYSNYAATALDGFWETGTTPVITDPEGLAPSLTSAGPQSLVFNAGRIVTSNWGGLAIGSATTPGQRIDAVSTVFMADSILNEYSTLASNNESSEWVITFPTKRFYVDPALHPTTVVPPFTNRYLAGSACDPIGIASWNREEFPGLAPTGGFSPPAPGQAGPALCFETNVLTFNQIITNATNGTSSPSKIFGSVHARNITTPRISTPAGNNTQAGWTRISFPGSAAVVGSGRTRPSVEGHRFVGLPVTGFWAVSIENNAATPGVKGFYGGLYNHRNSRRCEAGAAGQFTCFTP